MDEKTFHALAAAVAKALGGAVTRRSEPNEHCFADMMTAEGLPLELAKSWNDKGKLRARVRLPHRGEGASSYIARDLYSRDEVTPDTEIGVSEAKTAERIAADIKRRLIPGAADAYMRACRQRDADKAFRDGKAATVARLRKALKCEERGPRGNTDMVYAPGFYMQVSSADSVSIERMYVRPETALKIHALLMADKGDKVSETAPDKYGPKLPQEITQERFFNALECLPPCQWRGMGTGFESFHVSERLSGNVVSWFVCFDGRYFQADQEATITRDALRAMVAKVAL